MFLRHLLFLKINEQTFIPFQVDNEVSCKEERNDGEINLPYEVLLKVFKYLQPKELCRCAQVSKKWSAVAMDPGNWSVLHPSRWGRGDFTFGQETSSDDCNCDCEPNYNMMEFREYVSVN